MAHLVTRILVTTTRKQYSAEESSVRTANIYSPNTEPDSI